MQTVISFAFENWEISKGTWIKLRFIFKKICRTEVLWGLPVEQNYQQMHWLVEIYYYIFMACH